MRYRLALQILRWCAPLCLVAVALDRRSAALTAALDCSVPAESTVCASNEDCVCGTNGSTAQCEVGVPACVSTDRDCANFCQGEDGRLVAVCRQGQCRRARLTRCPGDCDGDARVDVAELVTGVGIMLGKRPPAACESLDADRDETSRVHELIDAVGAALRGCGAALPPVVDRRGTYDAILIGGAGAPFAGTSKVVAEATNIDFDDGHARIGISISLRPNRGIAMSGRLVGATAALEGGYHNTDIAMPLRGTATIANTDEEEVIEGSFRSPPGRGSGQLDGSFVMRRSHTSTPVRFAGRYRFETTESPGGTGQPSAFTVGLDIAPDGAALMSESPDIGPGEMTLGSLMSGECFVAPGGHLRCSTLYLVADSVLSTRLRFTGKLSSDGAAITGEGAFLSGLDPPRGPEPYVPGAWTARRLSDIP